MEKILRIFIVFAAFAATNTFALGIICEEADEFPWDYQVRVPYTASEAQNYTTLGVGTYIEKFKDTDSETYYDEYNHSPLNSAGATLRVRYDVGIGWVGVGWSAAAFPSGTTVWCDGWIAFD